MLPELTPAAARAVEVAQLRAQCQGAASICPDDLLYGLLQEEEGRAAVLTTGAGADVAAIRASLEIRRTPTQLAPIPAFGESCQAIFALATELAVEWTAEHIVGSDALIVALLRADAGLRHQLEANGLKWESFESQLPRAARPPLEFDEPLSITQPAEHIDLARILDAAANRAREGLRVVEDYCRFALDDPFLTRETKQMRHDLADALAKIPARLLLEARDTPGDVGTRITTASEQTRHSLREVVAANLKRLQEALRSLEEHGKIANSRISSLLEQIRHRAYTLERSVLLSAAAREQLADTKLCVLLTSSHCAASLDWTIQEAAAGGARMIQLREKQLGDRSLLERARNVRRWTRQAGALFIVNDRPDIALLAEADGVHLGQDDIPVKEARRILGPNKLIGVSTHNIDQLRQAICDGVSYLGVGPTFPSGTKVSAELAGLDFVRQAMAETSLPAFVIGGVNLDTIGAAVAAGAQRVAVSQAICQADDPRAAAAALVRALESV